MRTHAPSLMTIRRGTVTCHFMAKSTYLFMTICWYRHLEIYYPVDTRNQRDGPSKGSAPRGLRDDFLWIWKQEETQNERTWGRNTDYGSFKEIEKNFLVGCGVRLGSCRQLPPSDYQRRSAPRLPFTATNSYKTAVADSPPLITSWGPRINYSLLQQQHSFCQSFPTAFDWDIQCQWKCRGEPTNTPQPPAQYFVIK